MDFQTFRDWLYHHRPKIIALVTSLVTVAMIRWAEIHDDWHGGAGAALCFIIGCHVAIHVDAGSYRYRLYMRTGFVSDSALREFFVNNRIAYIRLNSGWQTRIGGFTEYGFVYASDAMLVKLKFETLEVEKDNVEA